MGALWLVTGGARSGKSRFAERLAARSEAPVVYLATMEALDDEVSARIEQHRATRPETWRTIEEPLSIFGAMQDVPADACVLIDCISLWVSNRLLAFGEPYTPERVAALERALLVEVDALVATARERCAPTIFVTNEVGAGLVPEYELGRAYRDVLGRVNQRASLHADAAWLLVAGRPLALPPPEA